MRTRIFLMLSIICFSFCVQLQSQVTGEIRDANNNLISGATVFLKKLPDSVVVRTMLSDDKGRYVFSGIRQGNYFLNVTMVGLKEFKSAAFAIDSVHKTYEHSPIVLSKSTTTLGAVTVTASKPFIERLTDRTVMNVDAFLSSAGSTALEMLEKAPGVTVEESGISLRGKSGVVIFINDKPSYLSGAELINYLKSLPASSLDKIEVITNPPARYDAAGNAGIINIRIKKTKAGGFNGGLNLSVGQGKYPRSNNSFNFNYRANKFNVFGSASHSLSNGLNDLSINRYYFHGDGSERFTFFQQSWIRRTANSYNLRVGVDYYLSDRTTIGILTGGVYRPSREKTLNTSTVRNSNGNVDSIITAENFQKGTWKNGNINLNLLHKYKRSGKEISADIDYVNFTSGNNQQFFNKAYSPDGAMRWHDELSGDLPSIINIYSAKTDYTQPLGKSGKISAGLKLSFVSTDNAAEYFATSNGVTEPDLDKTNHFKYDEGINSAYISGNKDWKFFSLQLGLRFENTISDGHQLGNSAKPDSAFRRSYTNLFPTTYFLYKFDTFGKNQISFSYGRRIDRPFYQDLNPFISPLDKFSIYVGNPYLQPTFTNNFALAWIFKNKVTTTLSYSRTKNIIRETIDLSNNIYVSRPANLGKNSVLGLSVDISVRLAKWWNLINYAEAQSIAYNDFIYGYQLDTSTVYFLSSMTNQFTIGKGWSAELGGFFRTAVLSGQIISGRTGMLNLSVGKKILRDKGSLRLVVRDILYTRLNHGIITSIKNAYGTYRNWGDVRTATLTFSYNFGKSTGSQRNRRSGTETEENRVRN